MANRTCSVEGCGKPTKSRNLCGTHYHQWRQAELCPPCSVEGCDKQSRTRGLCCSHYGYLRRTGNPVPPRKPTAEEQFCVKVDRRSDHECWPWLGQKGHYGHGHFAPYGRGSDVLAHRFAYELLVGPIPEGMTIDHVWARGCTRTDCVNALAHLEPVTQRENNLRSNNATALNARKTHCKNGHEFTPENTYVRPTGGRACRRCRLERERARRMTTMTIADDLGGTV